MKGWKGYGEYYRWGFQVVYAIHWDKEKKLHIHFAVNAVSFEAGKKFDASVRGNRERERIFNRKLYHYCRTLHPEGIWEWEQPEAYRHISLSIRLGAMQVQGDSVRKAVYFPA